MAKQFESPLAKLQYAQRQVAVFFSAMGAAVCHLRFIKDDNQNITIHALPDGTCLYNSTFVDGIPDNQLASQITHITLHTATQEYERARFCSAPAWKFRFGLEHCLHKILEEAGLPEILGTDSARHPEWDNLGPEQIAKLIGDPPPGIDPELAAVARCPARLPLSIGKRPDDEHGMPTTKPPLLSAALADMQTIAKSMGEGIWGAKLLVGDTFKPKVRWQDHLRFATSQVLGVNGRSYRNPHRRSGGISAATGRRFLFPGPNRGLDSLVLVLDSTGSVVGDHGLLEMFLGVMEDLLRITRRSCRVLIHEDRILEDFETRTLQGIRDKLTGGGGTHFACVYERLAESKKEIPMVVWLTDLIGRHEHPQPKYPLLWVTGETHGSVPWGRHLVIPKRPPEQERQGTQVIR